MRQFTLLLFTLIYSTASAQKSSLKIDLSWVLLTGNQKVYDYNPPSSKEKYKLTYVWPETTYTLFKINDDKKTIQYYTVSAKTVKKAKQQFSKDADILREVMANSKPGITFKYEILKIIDPVKGMKGNYIMGKMYILKLKHEKEKNANTTIEIRDGEIRYSSITVGKPYHVRYPVLNNEFFVNLKD